MKLYSASETNVRPVRLCEATRNLAFEALGGRWGDEAFTHPAVDVDDISDENWDALDDLGKYDAMIRAIVEKCPIRIVPGERIVGSANLGTAIHHVIPVTRGGNTIWGSLSHVTLGFDRAVLGGLDAMEAEIDSRIARGDLTHDQLRMEESMKNSLESARILHARYLEAVKDQKELYENLKNVPFSAPASFKEAVQSLWFCFAFTRLCGNWPGIGRIDEILGGFLEADLASGVITEDDARDYLAHFFIKGCEWIQSNTPVGSGDAQHYQNIVLGGINAEGNDITNAVTYLVLDIVEELAISDFPITVRISENTPAKLMRRTAEVMRFGGGIVAVYNEPLILESLTGYGYSVEEARRFANDGCWEVQVPGKTYFIYCPFDSLQLLLRNTLGLGADHKDYASYEELYSAYCGYLKQHVDSFASQTMDYRGHFDDNGEWIWHGNVPCSVVSVFTMGCMESGRSYLSGGPVYTVCSPHIGGAPDTANSLYAIKKLVFDEKRIALHELLDILENNWEGEEALRQYVRTHYTYYGNDSEEVDSIAAGILNTFADYANEWKGKCPVMFPAGVSTFGRQIEWAPYRFAVPHGFKKGDILAGNDSPTPGTDTEGATAEIHSYCCADLRKQTSGAALDVRLHPSAVAGEEGIQSIISLLRGFIRLGGFFMQLDSVDAQTLRDAQEHPENYKSLSVRVSGWNARFVTLNKEWQRMIIERSERGI